MDRIDDLLIKARAEMIGKAPKRNVVTKDDAFNMAWDMVKGYEDQMRALQEKRNKPGFFGRMKDAAKRGYQSARQPRPQQNRVPLPTTENTGDEGFVDFMGQQGGLETPSPTQTSRASGSPPGFRDFMGQQGGLDAPQALEPQEVPMREDINTEQPPAPAPVQAERTQSLPPTMRPEGISASQRAKNFGPPSDDEFVSAVQTLVPNSDYRSLLSEVNERRKPKEPREEGVSPLSSADVKQGSPMPELSQRTQGELGDRQDTAANENYQQVSDKRMEYAEAMERFVERGDMTEDESFDLWEQMQQSGSIPEWPKMKEEAQPSLDEANRALGGETLSPNQKRGAVDTPIPKREMAEPATTPVEPRNLPMRLPQGGVPAVRDKAPATEALPPNQLPMRRPAGALPERTNAQAPPRGSRRNQRSPLAVRKPRPDIKEQQLPSRQRRAERKRRNTAADKVEAERTPAPQPEPQVQEQSEPVKKPEPKPQVEEQTESVKKPEPKVEEQTTKKPPQSKQPTLFGGEEQTTAKPKDNKATVEEAQKRKAKRADKKQPTEQREKMPSINSSTDSEVISGLLDRAEEGDEEARKHLYNSMGDLEDHHPSHAERYKDTFENMVQDANLSLLPSAMRNSLVKEHNNDANYSLLPNGWV